MGTGARLDHLVVGADTLERGCDWLAQRLGVAPLPGGQHAAMGTHNALLRLGADSYVELIAVDPRAPAPARARWFALDDPDMRARLAVRPRLIHWVVACADIAAARAACLEPLGDILELARDDLRWRITVPADGHLPGDGVVPSLIAWPAGMHPARRLPEAGLTLRALFAEHPQPRRVGQALEALGFDPAAHLSYGPGPRLRALIAAPRGAIWLD